MTVGVASGIGICTGLAAGSGVFASAMLLNCRLFRSILHPRRVVRFAETEEVQAVARVILGQVSMVAVFWCL